MAFGCFKPLTRPNSQEEFSVKCLASLKKYASTLFFVIFEITNQNIVK